MNTERCKCAGVHLPSLHCNPCTCTLCCAHTHSHSYTCLCTTAALLGVNDKRDLCPHTPPHTSHVLEEPCRVYEHTQAHCMHTVQPCIMSMYRHSHPRMYPKSFFPPFRLTYSQGDTANWLCAQ